MIPTLGTRAGHDAAVRRLTRLSEQLADVQQQIATGKRVLKPGDAPVAFARAATLKRADAMAEAQRRAMDAASARLSTSEVALADIAELALRARELALAGANDTLAATDRAAMAAEVRELLASARALAETRGPDGEALFAGMNTPPAYADDADGLAAWAGLGQVPQVAVGGRLVAAGITGPEAFGVTAPLPPPDPLAPPPDPAVPPPPPLPPLPRERNLFDSLAHLAATLEETRPAFFRAGIDEAIAAITGHGDRLSAAQALLGARGARLEAEAARLDNVQLALKADISRLEDTDLAEAVARLDRLGVVLEAAQASFARVARLSLWDQIR
jgi:flagellar hook-associated protein 3 FlgL